MIARMRLAVLILLAACGGSGATSGDATSSSHDAASAVGSDAGGSGDASCGCHGEAGCAVWSNVYISWYGFNDNSCTSENQHGCNDIAYPAPEPTAGQYGTPYPNAANITHTQANEGAGTYDDPITAAASADTDPETPTAKNPRHTFESFGGATLTPGTKIYNPEVQKYFIFEDSCLECGDEWACIVSPEDTDDGTVPANCTPSTNLHIDFWMGPSFSTDTNDLDNCEDDSTVGSDWVGGGGDVIVNPPSDLPVATGVLYTGSGAGGGCWTPAEQAATTCP
jgi:hypothetical protein